MTRTNRLRLCLVASALSLIPLAAAAGNTTYFSDFGPGHSYQSWIGWAVAGANVVPPGYVTAAQFTAASSGGVTEIDVGLGFAKGTNSAVVSLFTDNKGVPGAQLGMEWTVTNMPKFGNTSNSIQRIKGITNVTLTKGMTYFLEIAPPDDDSWSVWNRNNTDTMGMQLYSINGGASWQPQKDSPLAAFSVLATTPEPPTLMLLSSGLLGSLASLRRRPKNAN